MFRLEITALILQPQPSSLADETTALGRVHWGRLTTTAVHRAGCTRMAQWSVVWRAHHERVSRISGGQAAWQRVQQNDRPVVELHHDSFSSRYNDYPARKDARQGD